MAYQRLCGEITGEFNDCSKQVCYFSFKENIIQCVLNCMGMYLNLNLWFQVLEMESLLLMPDLCRVDLAELLKAVQVQEKQKLHLVTCSLTCRVLLSHLLGGILLLSQPICLL